MSEAPDRIWACVSKNTKSGVVTLVGDATFPVDGWQEYIRADRIEAQAAEIERLAKDKRWIIDERDRTFALMLSRAEKAEAEIERLRGERDEFEAMAMRAATIAQEQRALAALTVSATVKDYLTTEDEKQSHEWKCPIDYPGCRKNCGSYGCGN